MPALTVNRHGAGRLYYLAARPAGDLVDVADGTTLGARVTLPAIASRVVEKD